MPSELRPTLERATVPRTKGQTEKHSLNLAQRSECNDYAESAGLYGTAVERIYWPMHGILQMG
jgi:hypothetical protein